MFFAFRVFSHLSIQFYRIILKGANWNERFDLTIFVQMTQIKSTKG